MNKDMQDRQDGNEGKDNTIYSFAYADLSEKILSACFEVASELGCGFLESVYEKSLAIALCQMGLLAIRQVPIQVHFRGEGVGDFIADLLVENKVIVELKAVQALAPEHLAQTINYLNASEIETALLVNFGRPRLEYRRLFSRSSRKR